MLNGSPGGVGGRTNRVAAEALNIMRRVNHGGGTWRFRDRELRQPQDGASLPPSGTVEIQTRLGRAVISEPDDARLTGGTRSLTRRLLGLNLTGLKSAMAPQTRLAAAPDKKLSGLSVGRRTLGSAPAA